MAEPDEPAAPAASTPPATRRACADDDKVICEHCGVGMFRMHAVWRCPNRRYKTDCCGW